jgi:hypothetical protein
VKVTLHPTFGSGADVEIDGNRSSDLAAHTEIYKYSQALPLGPYMVGVSFFSQPNQTGVLTGTAGASAALFSCGCLENPNESPLGTVTFSSRIKSVLIPVNQSLAVGATTQLNVSPIDGNGNMVAVSPGSLQFQIVSGSSSASITPDGIMSGLAAGSANVTATVDGVTSSATQVSVTP